MSEVFVSYARPDEGQAVRVADALRSAGYNVWRDDQLPAHRAYAEVIEERLSSADAVVVLWSPEAAKSEWVRAEADAARSAGKLAQATLDGTVPPMPFNQFQCADLNGWTGQADAAGWCKLRGSIAALAGPADGADEMKGREAPRELSVCVLPFANMSGDSEQEYFSDGISEDITTDLSKVSALSVTARNTAFLFKGQAVDVCDVASRLCVSHVLEGSVRKAGNRVRITAQLIDGQTGDHVWADRYDRDLTDIFAIQDELSKAIVDALKVRLLPDEKEAIANRGTTEAEAYKLYLKARQVWVAGNHGDKRREEQVIRLCHRAVEIDPQYAKAWALMATAQSNLHHGFGQGRDDGVAAADKALSLDGSITEALCAKSRHLSERGQFEPAVELVNCALRDAPRCWELNKEAARLHMLRRDVRSAALHYQAAAEEDETDYHSWCQLLTCYNALHDDRSERHAASKVIEATENVLAQDPTNGGALAGRAHGFATLDEPDRAKHCMEQALRLDPDNLNMQYNFACVLASKLHDREGAIELLSATLPKIKASLGFAEVDPDLDSIRDDPRFIKLLADAKGRLARRGGECAAAPAVT